LDKDKGVGIGWTHMLEGKITGISELYNLSLHLQQQCNAHINGQDWVKLFISTKSVKISLSHTMDFSEFDTPRQDYWTSDSTQMG
jgi:hypothetical protein